MGHTFIGNAEDCLHEAFELAYAYFSPELDNFNPEITVDDVLFKVIRELDLLDDGFSLKEYAKDSGYRWSVLRNKAWRKKAVAFLHRWADQAGESESMYKEVTY